MTAKNTAPPLFYVLHGEDEFTLRREVRAMREKMNDPGMLNTAFLDGKTSSFGAAVAAARVMPFLAERRLVILEGLYSGASSRRSSSKAAKADYEAMVRGVQALPETARLVFLETKALDDTHPLLKLANQPTLRGLAKTFPIPALADLPRWISKRIEAEGGNIEPKAALALGSAFVGVEHLSLYAVESECAKLIDYARGRLITEKDVAALTVYVAEANIFSIVDAIGRGDGQRATALIERILSDPKQEPLQLFGMIIRQFRILIQVREKIDTGGNVSDLPEAKYPKIAQSFREQARRFELPQLEGIYRNLLDTDYAIKTGRVEGRLALDLFVAGLTG
ncbi:MAG: DNA polymerase III subunit delta [Anaerolineales bacterium]|nr:DNA polymerase III subunit delta [Anaerolineales bacterium]